MVESLNFEAMRADLGDGPMRFSSENERSLQDQLDSLTSEEKECVEALKLSWEKYLSKDKTVNKEEFSDAMLLRFARCSPGVKKFNKKAAIKVMKKFDTRYLTLRAEQMEDQLRSKTLFPIPNLQSMEGHDVFYMRPSRYYPKTTSTKQIIDNLAYCMQTMVEKEKACTEGIAFMANMDGWTFENFSISYCHQFMMMLQGRVPVRVRLFLIVNPPGWFGQIWKIMKPMLASDFRKKVHMIPYTDLDKYLMTDYKKYLPDDVTGIGLASTDGMVDDFVAYRKHVEKTPTVSE